MLPDAPEPPTRLIHWRQSRAEAARCRQCPIGEHATQAVFGEGPLDARLMLVGEQPGDREDLEGHPFAQWLEAEIELVAPEVIGALGATSASIDSTCRVFRRAAASAIEASARSNGRLANRSLMRRISVFEPSAGPVSVMPPRCAQRRKSSAQSLWMRRASSAQSQHGRVPIIRGGLPSASDRGRKSRPHPQATGP